MGVHERGSRMEKGLYDTLTEYCRRDILPMHMPGHKRSREFCMENPYAVDVTEVEGLDDLHHPAGVIRSLAERITRAYHSEQSYLLVNGSTGGILASVAACCHYGDSVVVARNCHRSVYHAIRLLGLRPVYLYPSGEGGAMETLGIPGIITAGSVKEALLACKAAACVIVTSPTYEGVVSPIREIAEVTADFHVPLIIDEAHGAHFNWHEAFPATALEEGADLVVESLHKTLPSLTQTAVLHAAFGLVSRPRLEWCLRTFQSSSPSYILMSGIDRCIAFLEREGEEAFERYAANLQSFTGDMEKLRHLYLFDSPRKEKSKLVVATDRAGMTGRELAARLRGEYGIETEMSCGNYCIAMTSVCDRGEHFERFGDALLRIDEEISETAGSGEGRQADTFQYVWMPPVRGKYSFEAAECRSEEIALEAAAGRMAAEDIMLYPPGIPLIVQGEYLSPEAVALLLRGGEQGYIIQGVEDGVVNVIKTEE